MRIEALWGQLEADAAGDPSADWLTRFAMPDPHNSLLVAIEPASGARALLLPLTSSSMPARKDWPECNGLGLFTVPIDGRPNFGIRLLDSNYSDFFSALAEDIAPRVAATVDATAAARVLLDRLRRWQKFLAAGTEGLSPSSQRGLFGELLFLQHSLAPIVGIAGATEAWRASLRTHQDFQFARAAIEVKTTSAKQPQSVRITSERQLDSTGIPALFLYVSVLDERTVDPEGATIGETLPDRVEAIRNLLPIGTAGRDTFDDRLTEARYLDSHSRKYLETRYTPRAEHLFAVAHAFPRVTEGDLPLGIGDVSYALSLAACAPFAKSMSSLAETFKQKQTTAGAAADEH
jgi:Putative  PD-(D/E)XK family member, (DUF4420)